MKNARFKMLFVDLSRVRNDQLERIAAICLAELSLLPLAARVGHARRKPMRIHNNDNNNNNNTNYVVLLGQSSR